MVGVGHLPEIITLVRSYIEKAHMCTYSFTLPREWVMKIKMPFFTQFNVWFSFGLNQGTVYILAC